jgi:hypothetical protein
VMSTAALADPKDLVCEGKMSLYAHVYVTYPSLYVHTSRYVIHI